MREKQDDEIETPTPKRRGPGRPRAAAGSRGLPGLRAALVAAGMTQAQLAARLGLLHSAVNLYVRGVCDPSIARLKEIAAIVGCSLEDLVYPPPPTAPADAAPAVVDDVAATA